jgi:hypothetical protein
VGEGKVVTYIAVFLLYELEEGAHVRPPEVVVGPQPGEQAPAEQPLEVVLTYVLNRKNILLFILPACERVINMDCSPSSRN